MTEGMKWVPDKDILGSSLRCATRAFYFLGFLKITAPKLSRKRVVN
jgi:hypothetical protein